MLGGGRYWLLTVGLRRMSECWKSHKNMIAHWVKKPMSINKARIACTQKNRNTKK